MPILDTVVLFAAADPEDKLHDPAVSYLSKLGRNLLLGTFALLEFDVVLKSNGFSSEKRMEEISLLLRDYPLAAKSINRISPSTIYFAALYEREFRLDYFDALIAAEATELDSAIVTSDREFERIPNLKRIPLTR
jgi:predicted nucleic acid-binding protein